MLELRLHVPTESADPIVERLSRTPGLSHLTLIPLAKTSKVVIQAELDPVHADAILAELNAMGLTADFDVDPASHDPDRRAGRTPR